MEGDGVPWGSEPGPGGGGMIRELCRSLGRYRRYLGRLKQNLRETQKFFRDIKCAHHHSRHSAPTGGGGGERGPAGDVAETGLQAGRLSCISFPPQEEKYLQQMVDHLPCILVLGQDCHVKCQLLNLLLGVQVLPTTKLSSEESCKLRRLRFTYGTQTRVSLALPGQYELVHTLVAHQGTWETIPEEDLEVQEGSEDAAHVLAELEVMMHHALLQEVDIVVAPCHSLRPTVNVLGDLVNDCLPVITYALHKDELSERDEQELQEIRKCFPFPVFFFKVPELDSEIINSSSRRVENERSPLHRQLTDLGYLGSSHCNCGATGQDTKAQSMLVEQSEKLRHLSTFSHQLLQTRLVDAAKALNLVHCRCLDIFINQAFDMQRDLQITPKRLEYTRKKENELYESLMNIANRKQEEMKDMIVETLNTMKEELLDDAANMEFKDVIVPENGEPVGTREIKCCIRQIQELIISQLNQAVANKLISSVDYLRESFVGTLERCLQSLEKSQDVSVHITSNYLKQILNAAYHVEVTFHSGSSVTRMLWEQIKQIILRITWVSPPAVTLDWKRKVAQEAIESLSASKLAKSICSQFRTRLNCSHEAFAASLRQLEAGHSGRLEKTEDLWLRVRKDHAPRLARLSLESRSLQDVLLHHKPKLGQELGRGQYGVVYLCDSWGGHFPCALKSVVPPDEKHWNDLALEFHYMRSLPKHERLVDLHGSVIDYNYGGGSSIAVLLIMERLHRDLYSGLKAGLMLETRLQVALDVVEGIRFLHSQGLVHRDIKLKNVLLDKQNRAKITDLGFCKPEAMMSGSIVGTPIHMAPELFTGKYDNSVDVYAFGILFWYICSGSIKLPEAFERCASKDHLWNNVRRESFGQNYPEEADGTLDCISMALTCTFNRWGTLLAVGCNDGRIVIWDFLTRGIAKIISAHIHPVCSLCWSRDGHKLVSASTDNIVSQWDVLSGDCDQRFRFPSPILKVQYHPRDQNKVLVCPMKSAPVMLTLSDSKHVVLPVDDDSDLNVVASFDRRGEYIYTGNAKGKILVLKTDSQDLVASFRVTTGTSNTTAIKSIEFARKGSCFLINTADRIIRVYDGREILTCGRDGEPEPMQKLQDLVNRTPWKKCCFSGDGEYIVAGSARQHALYIWEKSIGNLVKILHGTRGELLLDVAWHPVRPIIASISSGVVSIWAQNQVENWSAFAPDFKELDENVEYEERESEFDIEDEDKSEPEQTGADAAEDEEVDVTSVDPIAAFCSSDEELEDSKALLYLPIAPEVEDPEENPYGPPPDAVQTSLMDEGAGSEKKRQSSADGPQPPKKKPKTTNIELQGVPSDEVHPLLGVKGDGKSKKKQAGRPKGSKAGGAISELL
ncbi:dual serine/threonine and tyrosine protein kinase isoform X2 [Manis pentadactyla]|uniref:dual serine/threonine and tyrosine protein kinase isoform X2 n=1 Tax=Manis pentadactyla TaxID=143292 RepID=UPI00255CF0B8|nr:dual serine/threonine and tyrosine protein kinase isoform X2 [Manis pentadactyla]